MSVRAIRLGFYYMIVINLVDVLLTMHLHQIVLHRFLCQLLLLLRVG